MIEKLKAGRMLIKTKKPAARRITLRLLTFLYMFLVTTEYLAKFLFQRRTAKVFGDDLSVRAYQPIFRNTLHPVLLGHCIIPELKIAYMCPGKIVFINSLQPFILLPGSVKRYA
jgi:hypothetical protein